jgi:hypothetical protein
MALGHQNTGTASSAILTCGSTNADAQEGRWGHPGGDLASVLDLGQDVLHAVFGRALGDVEQFGDLAVGKPSFPARRSPRDG